MYVAIKIRESIKINKINHDDFLSGEHQTIPLMLALHVPNSEETIMNEMSRFSSFNMTRANLGRRNNFTDFKNLQIYYN